MWVQQLVFVCSDHPQTNMECVIVQVIPSSGKVIYNEVKGISSSFDVTSDLGWLIVRDRREGHVQNATYRATIFGDPGEFKEKCANVRQLEDWAEIERSKDNDVQVSTAQVCHAFPRL